MESMLQFGRFWSAWNRNAGRGLNYERLDQLTVDVLLSVR